MLRRFRRGEGNAFQRQHLQLGGGPARGGETADLAAGRKHPVTGNDEGDGVFRHGLPHLARALRPDAEFAGKCAIGRRLAPMHAAGRVINRLEEIALAGKVERNVGEIGFLAGKVALRGGNGRGDGGRRFGGLRLRQVTKEKPARRRGILARKLKAHDARLGPGDAAGAALGLEDQIVMGLAGHDRLLLPFRHKIGLCPAAFNPFLAGTCALTGQFA